MSCDLLLFGSGRRSGSLRGWFTQHDSITQYDNNGGLPEWSKGAVCKTAGSAYVGSNPTPATSWHGTSTGPGSSSRGRRLCAPGRLVRE